MHLNKWQSLHFLGNVSTIRKQLIVSLGCIDQVVHHQKQVNGGYSGGVEPLEAPNLERRALRTSAASYITLSLHDYPPTILTACASFCDLDSLRQLLHCWSWWGGSLPKKRKGETLLLWLPVPWLGSPEFASPCGQNLGNKRKGQKARSTTLLSSSPSILLETGFSQQGFSQSSTTDPILIPITNNQ